MSDVFYTLTGAETNDQLQAITKQIAPLLSALRDDIRLNEALFARVKAVQEKRDEAKLTPEQKKLVEDTYKDFVRGGANLSAEQKKRFREINQELSVLGIRFADNLLKEMNAYRLVVEKKEDLAGLPPGVVAAAADAAKAAKLEGKWVFTLQAPSIWPFLTFAENRELRKQILTAYTIRCDKGDETDNKAGLSKTAALRAERAKLLGFPTWADFVLDDNMAKTPARVYELLDRVWKPALEVAKVDAKDLAAALKADGKGDKLEAWDWRYYAEKVRKARYDLDDQELRPYFPLDRVREGAFSVANRLYGITFTERTDVPKYHPEVKTFEVKDADGSFLALYTTDYHPRPGKRGGAWCGRLRDQWVKDGKDVRPIVTNVTNFTRPAGDAPALLSLEEVETLFHEFGHALHRILSRVTYRSMARRPAGLRRAPLPDHGELGARARGPEGLREALEDERADSGRPRREDREVEALRPGLRDRRVRGRVLPRHELAHADRAEARGRNRLREGVAREDRAHPRDRLPLPEPLLPAHLRARRRLLRRLLQLPLERGPRRRRLRGVPREGDLRQGDRHVLPEEHPREGGHRRGDVALQGLPRPRAVRAAAPRAARPRAGRRAGPGGNKLTRRERAALVVEGGPTRPGPDAA